MTQDAEIATLRRQLSAHHDRRGERSLPDDANIAATHSRTRGWATASRLLPLLAWNPL
jgi:hypothetical protein